MSSYCVEVDGVVFTLNGPPTDDDLEALRELAAHMRAKLPELTPEQVEQQAAGRARIHERLERLGRT